jgi:hypothetical protein
MRKTTKKILDAFAAGKPAREKACWTDGKVFYSYDTPIAWHNGDGRVCLNETRYSVTTSQQQGVIRQYFAGKIVTPCVVHDDCKGDIKLAWACGGAK